MGSKRSKSNKKGGQLDRKSRQKLVQKLQNCQMRDFDKQLDQLIFNVIVTNQFFLQKEEVNKIELGIKGIQWGQKM